MKTAYRIYTRKNGNFYLQRTDDATDLRSLRTKDARETQRRFDAPNDADRDDGTAHGSAPNLELGKVYMRAADGQLAKRTWQTVMDEQSSRGIEATQTRYKREFQSRRYDAIRNKPLIETNAEH